jgi:alanine-synthesizing transaminase
LKFSRRSDWQRQPNALARAVELRRNTGQGVVDLTLSNPTRAGIDYPEKIWRVLAAAESRIYEPDARGLRAARDAVCAYYSQHSIAVNHERVRLTCSTSEAYALLFKLLCDPGERVLVPRPSYPLFQYLAGLEGVDVGSYPLRYGDGRWAVDLDRLAAAIDARTRAIVLVNPNNPTGSYINAAERQAIEALACECNVAIISDEVFYDYALDGPRGVSFAEQGVGLHFALSGLSKVLALPSAKLGWMVVGGEEALREEALARLEIVADTYLSVGGAIQEVLPNLLAQCEAVQQGVKTRIGNNYNLLKNALGSSAELCTSAGGWYGVVRVEGADDEALALGLLERENVLVHPGYFYDFSAGAYLVLSLLPADFANGVEGLANFLKWREKAG